MEISSQKQVEAGSLRIEFSCKSINPSKLPALDQESMNSQGNAKIKDVADYIFFEDGLFKHIKGAPTPANRKKPENTKRAIDYIDLILMTHIMDEETNKPKEIILDPELSLGNCKKYMFDLIDIEGKAKSMPLYYKVKGSE